MERRTGIIRLRNPLMFCFAMLCITFAAPFSAHSQQIECYLSDDLRMKAEKLTDMLADVAVKGSESLEAHPAACKAARILISRGNAIAKIASDSQARCGPIMKDISDTAKFAINETKKLETLYCD